jgi:hypothetical protein
MVDDTEPSDWYRQWEEQQEREHQEGRDAVIAACGRLAELGVTSVTIPYDGCGDSGTVDDPIGHRGEVEVELPKDLSESLVDAAYNLLPGGWEINEDSSGELTLDVRERSLRRNHAWRILQEDREEELLSL